VTIDGAVVGHTPTIAANLALGAHVVVVSRPGYAAETRRVTLTRRASAATVTAQLRATAAARGARAAAGAIAVDSRPRGAKVWIDGKAVGATPVSVPGFTPGTHSVRLELNGYKPLATRVTVKPGETARIAVTLEQR